MDGLGYHEGACPCCPRLVGSAVIVQYQLVMDVFWIAPYWLVIGHCQPVARGRGDRYPDIQTDQAGGRQFDDAIGSVAGICLGLEFFSMAYEWRRSGVCDLIRSRLE